MDIGALIGLASAGAGAIGNATGAAKDLRKFIKGNDKLPTKVSELCLKIYDELLDAKRDQGELEDRLRDLRKEIEKLDRFKSESARYELFTSETGALIYALKPDNSDGEPHHYICPNCFEDSHKSILQPQASTLICPRCTIRFGFKKFNLPTRTRTKGYW